MIPRHAAVPGPSLATIGALRRLVPRPLPAAILVALLLTGCSTGGLAAPRPARRHPAPAITRRPHAAPSPPYAVRELTLPLVDPTRPTVAHGEQLSSSRALTTLVWVPDAPGPRPLVIFAPGFAVGPPPYEPLLERWAASGYVVAAIEFPLTDAAVAGPNLDEGDLENQPLDVDFVTRSLLGPASPLRSRIDPGEVALAGHSDGAETVLGATSANGSAGEPSYRAVVAISAKPLVATAPPANPPIIVLQGDADTTDPPADGYEAFTAAAAPKYLSVLHGGGHLPPVEAGSAWFPTVAAVTTAFLDRYLEGRDTPNDVVRAGTSPDVSTVFVEAGTSPSP